VRMKLQSTCEYVTRLKLTRHDNRTIVSYLFLDDYGTIDHLLTDSAIGFNVSHTLDLSSSRAASSIEPAQTLTWNDPFPMQEPEFRVMLPDVEKLIVPCKHTCRDKVYVSKLFYSFN